MKTTYAVITSAYLDGPELCRIIAVDKVADEALRLAMEARDTARAQLLLKQRGIVVLKDFPNHEIHRDGRVFRVRGSKQGEVRSYQGNRLGHYKINIRHAGVRHNFWLHRLICRAFYGEPPVYETGKTYVRHLDGDPSNNHADNLCYGSRSENEQDKKRFCAPLVGRISEDYDSDYFDA